MTNINNDNNNWTMTGREHDVTEFIQSLVKALETELADDSESVCDLRTLFRTETQRQLKCQNDEECGALHRFGTPFDRGGGGGCTDDEERTRRRRTKISI